MTELIHIRDRYDVNRIIYTAKDGTKDIKEALLAAIKDKANLYGANLSGANLSGANLSGAVISGANLSGAVISGANLYDANLYGANLSGANLSRADLSRANLSGANLSGANLSIIKNDLFEVLLTTPREIAGLKLALIEGRINGLVYESDCACLVGTIANVRGVKYCDVTGLKPDSNRPAERFFLGISKGQTPDTNPIAKIIVEWIDEFQTKLSAATII